METKEDTMSVVRQNLMTEKGYSPYCGGQSCRQQPRTNFDGEQFRCPHCSWRSNFDAEFIAQYKQKWGL